MLRPNKNRAYRLRTTAESDEYHIVSAPNPRRARFHFAMHLKNSRKAEEFLLALKLIRCCDRASEYDAWAAGASAGTIKTEKQVKELIKK